KYVPSLRSQVRQTRVMQCAFAHHLDGTRTVRARPYRWAPERISRRLSLLRSIRGSIRRQPDTPPAVVGRSRRSANGLTAYSRQPCGKGTGAIPELSDG